MASAGFQTETRPRPRQEPKRKALPRARVRAVWARLKRTVGGLEPGAACRQSWGGYGAAPARARKDRPWAAIAAWRRMYRIACPFGCQTPVENGHQYSGEKLHQFLRSLGRMEGRS